EHLLESARGHVAHGRFNEALDSYDAALGEEPENESIYFRRATVHLALGRLKPAVRDFGKTLQYKPDHTPALTQRSKIHIKYGAFDDALRDLRTLQGLSDGGAEVAESLAQVQELKEKTKAAQAAAARGKCEESISILSEVLSSASHSADLRFQRANCFLKTGDKEMAIADLTRVSRLDSDNTDILLRISDLHIAIGELDSAISSVKECLRLDPDHKECKTSFRKLRKLQKVVQSADMAAQKRAWQDVIKHLTESKAGQSFVKSIEPFGNVVKLHAWNLLCQAYAEEKQASEAEKWCSKVLEVAEDNIDALIYRAQAKIANEDYEGAMRDYQKASQHAPNDQRIQTGYSKAQRLLKQSSVRDYYKILGVSRNATPREIKSAYKKLVKRYHPDKYQGPTEEADKKMGELNDAFKVLSDENLRKRFDAGDDPNVSNWIVVIQISSSSCSDTPIYRLLPSKVAAVIPSTVTQFSSRVVAFPSTFKVLGSNSSSTFELLPFIAYARKQLHARYAYTLFHVPHPGPNVNPNETILFKIVAAHVVSCLNFLECISDFQSLLL
ncbi:hypothetical protein DFS34DRAFT_659853, partial [Phlyctochytrium arcticum]